MNVTQLDTLWQHLATFKCCLIAGLEPHSALPVALPMVFTDHCDLLPKGLRGIKILAHTAVTFLDFVLSGLEIGFFNNYLSPQIPTAVIVIAIAHMPLHHHLYHRRHHHHHHLSCRYLSLHD